MEITVIAIFLKSCWLLVIDDMGCCKKAKDNTHPELTGGEAPMDTPPPVTHSGEVEGGESDRGSKRGYQCCDRRSLEAESKNFFFHSLDRQHCQAAAANLRNLINGKDSFLFIQEPYLRGLKLAKMQGLNLYYADGTNPRAAIVGTPNTNVWLCPEFSGRDICTTVWVTGTGSETDCNNTDQHIYLAPMYLDIMPVMDCIFPLGWKELVTHCISSRSPLIACIDTNAHSVLWGETNPRGEVIENYIFSHSLVVENGRRVPTFSGGGASTCIDVTLSLNLPSTVDGWRVSDDTTLSDHRQIGFSLGLGQNICTEAIPNVAKANWDRFREILGEKSFRDPQYMRCLQRALHRVCPLRRGPRKVNRPYYWEGELEELRRLTRRAWRRYSHNHSDDDWTACVESRRAFQRGVRRAKWEAWTLFMEDTGDSKAMSQLFKIVQGRENQSINLLSDAPVNDLEGMVNHLMDVHYPGSTSVGLKGEDNVFFGGFADAGRKVDYVTLASVLDAISSFGNTKAGGPGGLKPVVLKNLPINCLGRLQAFYIAYLFSGYVPACWRRVKVVFIRKPGKLDFTKAKAFCPITLTSL